ncbi:GNAT family N-acetyltransferase [Myxococcus sp. RHSTA-1-4]|uniref:GNAT family N-acetyltransferase n=1 Tax=Myxococcus sp. RHSTA-1-4 TaxID=2874601 RepID=UPI001CBE004B|nr:GNAT family N-acetyltransferase [Myxococcus sp. RHSTA-1-4]MBZ4422470.1 GNAT family N-acetyltransferase [Myxococcus sp. RHSTA-1-4]
MPGTHSPLSVAPALETERLVLRGHVLGDFADSVALWADPEVTRHITGKPSTEEETWARLLRYVGHWALLGFGYWVVRERATGRFVGEVGFADFKRDLTPSIAGVPEAGWALAPWAHGKGYATEAVRAAHTWCEARFGAIRTVCIIAPENTASLRVAARCDFKEVTRTTYKGEPSILFERRGVTP